MSKENTSSRRHASSFSHAVVAGYASGITGTLVGHPFDSIKVWMQTGTTKRITKSPQLQRSLHTQAAPVHFHQQYSSLRRLYAGVTAPLLTVGMVQAINFAVYDAVKQDDQLTSVARAAGAAGAVLACLTSPLLLTKVHQQTKFMNFGAALRHTYKTGLFVAFAPHFCGEVGGRMVYFTIYEHLKRQREASLPYRMLCAAVAGVTCWSVIFPLDVVRNRMYSLAGKPHMPTASSLFVDIVKNEGWRSLYRGYGVTLLRAGPVAAAVLPVYDGMRDWLDKYP